MKAFLKSAGTGWGSFFYLIIFIPIARSATERWQLIHYTVLSVLVVFYVWKFLVQPFRAGLRDEVSHE